MRLARRRPARLGLNMTPMIDVTFLLLIFFMTVHQVSRVNKEPLALPQLAGTQDQSESAVTINLDREGRILVSGQVLSLPELAGLLGQELAAVGGDPAHLVVLVRADRRGNCRTVNQVMALLSRLDILRVRLAVEAPS
jgi:biopolymer transport protein ExbD